MRTITYGFYIYIFLTTIYEISGDSTAHSTTVVSKCDLLNTTISKAVEKCTTHKDTVLLPELDSSNVNLYLCTGIFDIAKRICQLNVNITSLIPTTFDAKINTLSKPQEKDLTMFCSAMNNVISNESYSAMINSTAYPNIAKLNQNLRTAEGCNRICWTTVGTTNSLCTVLLWEYEIIINAISLAEHITVKSTRITSDDQVQQALNSPQRNDNGHVLDNQNRNPGSKHQDEQQNKQKPKHKPTEAKDEQENKEEPKLDPTDAQDKIAKLSTGTDPSKDPSPNGNLPNESKGKKGQQSDTNSGTDGSSTPKTSRTSTNAVKDPEQSDAGIKNKLGDDNSRGNIAATDEAQDEHDMRELTNNNERIEENDNEMNIGSPPIEEKPINSLDKPSSPSNHESIVPKDYGLPYSGAPDPPQHFFAYFMAVSFICLICYVGYHKKHKIMAIIFEGRKSRGGRGRRRPNTAGYRKLDCNLEEAVTSQCNSNVTHVIY